MTIFIALTFFFLFSWSLRSCPTLWRYIWLWSLSGPSSLLKGPIFLQNSKVVEAVLDIHSIPSGRLTPPVLVTLPLANHLVVFVETEWHSDELALDPVGVNQWVDVYIPFYHDNGLAIWIVIARGINRCYEPKQYRGSRTVRNISRNQWQNEKKVLCPSNNLLGCQCLSLPWLGGVCCQ